MLSETLSYHTFALKQFNTKPISWRTRRSKVCIRSGRPKFSRSDRSQRDSRNFTSATPFAVFHARRIVSHAQFVFVTHFVCYSFTVPVRFEYVSSSGRRKILESSNAVRLAGRRAVKKSFRKQRWMLFRIKNIFSFRCLECMKTTGARTWVRGWDAGTKR